jgi:hypothetical protein
MPSKECDRKVVVSIRQEPYNKNVKKEERNPLHFVSRECPVYLGPNPTLYDLDLWEKRCHIMRGVGGVFLFFSVSVSVSVSVFFFLLVLVLRASSAFVR